MLKYLWYAHKNIILGVLIDLIVLTSLMLVALTSGMQEQFSNYGQFTDAFSGNIINFGFYLIYQFVLLIQYPLAFAITGYILTGNRYVNCLKVIGKPKTILLQALLLLATLMAGLIISLMYWNLLSPFYFNNMYSNTLIWNVFLGCLVSYHILFYSNIKYSSIIGKLQPIVLSVLIVASLQVFNNTIFILLNGINRPYLPVLVSNLNAISQVGLPAFTPDITVLIYVAINTLLIVLGCLVELKKVGR